MTFDLFRPNEGETVVKRLSSLVDQLSINVKVFLNSLPGPQFSDSSAGNAPRRPNCISRRLRYASTRVEKGRRSRLIALPGSKSCKPNAVNIGPASAPATVAVLKKRVTESPRRTLGPKGPGTDSRPVSWERFIIHSRKVGTAIWGFCLEPDPARVPERRLD